MSTSTPNEADAAAAAAGDTTDASESSCDVLGGTAGNDRKRRRCEICVESIAKYRCPACGVQTCSVPCVRQHKADTGCTGKPDLTTYVPLSSFDENLLLQDYGFLEEVKRHTQRSSVSGIGKSAKRFCPASRSVPEDAADSTTTPISEDGATAAAAEQQPADGDADEAPSRGRGRGRSGRGRGRGGRTSKSAAEWYLTTLPQALAKLVRSARSKRIELAVMPNGMSRRLANRTIVDFKSDVIRWSVEWQFQGVERFSLFDERVSEATVLAQALQLRLDAIRERQITASEKRARHLQALIDPGVVAMTSAEQEQEQQEEPVVPEAMQAYVNADATSMRFYLARAFHRANRIAYYELDGSKSILENLQDRTVIEFPTFHVALPTAPSGAYPLVSAEDDEEDDSEQDSDDDDSDDSSSSDDDSSSSADDDEPIAASTAEDIEAPSRAIVVPEG